MKYCPVCKRKAEGRVCSFCGAVLELGENYSLNPYEKKEETVLTIKDIKAVEELAQIANVDYKVYGLDMLKAGTSLEGMSKLDVLYNDFKLYNVGEKTFAVGQFFTMNFEEIEKEIDKYIDVLNDVAEANHYNLVTLYVTDIVKNGSYVLYNEKGKEKKIKENDE